MDPAGFHARRLVKHHRCGPGRRLGVSLAGEDRREGREPVDAAPGVRGHVDGLLSVGAGGGEVAEGAERVGVLRLDEASLHVAGLRRFLGRADASGHVLGAGHGSVAAVPVADPRVRLGLQGIQVGDQGG